jgi:RNA polymerase sigma factor (sigma-70 family)
VIDSDDLTLLRRWCDDRTDDAFAELVRRHALPVRETCRRRLRDVAAAEDAAQAVFLILARKAPGIVRSRWWSRPVIGDWLHRTAQHVCSNHDRQRRRRERHEREAAMTMAGASEPSTAELERIRERVDAALAALPARYRQPVVLHYLEGRARDEVARELGLSDEALKKRLQRALEMLRGRLGVAEGASAAVVAALAPAQSASGAQLAATISTYLHGAPLPAGVSIHVTGGLHAMRLAIAKTTIASCAGLAAVGGALAVAHAETTPAADAPAAVAQHPAVGTMLYWDSLIDWTFDLGGSNPGDPQQWMVPKRMLEYVIFRGEVKPGAWGGVQVAVAPVIGWRIVDGHSDSSGTGGQLHLPDGTVRSFENREDFAATLVFDALIAQHPKQFQLDVRDDRLARSFAIDPKMMEYSPLLDAISVPDLLLPLPSVDWKPGDKKPLAEGSATLAKSAPTTIDYALDHLEFPEQELFTHSEEIFGQKVQIRVLVGASGSGTAHVVWNDQAGAPEATTSSLKYRVQMRSRQAEGAEPTALLAGTLTLMRESHQLHPKLDGLPTLNALSAEIRRERQQLWWDRLDKPGDRPGMRALAYSVLNGLENQASVQLPQDVEQTNLFQGEPKPEEQPKSIKDF